MPGKRSFEEQVVSAITHALADSDNAIRIVDRTWARQLAKACYDELVKRDLVHDLDCPPPI